MIFKTHRNKSQSTNSSSIMMADLAFVLLIVFTLTIIPIEEKGLLVRLETWWEDEPPEVIEVQRRNIFSIGVYENQLFVQGEYLPIESLKPKVKEFIKNPSGSINLSTNPKNAVVGLHFNCQTTYSSYLAVYNELKKAYRELWEEEAMSRFGTHFNKSSRKSQKDIRNNIPQNIREDFWLCGGF